MRRVGTRIYEWIHLDIERRLSPEPCLAPAHFGANDFGALALLCLAAYLGNRLAVPLFAGVDLLFGSIAVMFTALRRSLVETAIVALAGALPTLALWGHPYALVILTAEAVFVHQAVARWRCDLTSCDAAFWFIVGFPLVLVFYAGAMSMGPVSVGLIALKQPANGLLCAAVASLIHQAAHHRSKHGRQEADPERLADRLTPMLVAFALVPTLVVVGAVTHLQQRHSLDQIRAELGAARDAIARLANSGLTSSEIEAIAPHSGMALVSATRAPDLEVPKGWLAKRKNTREIAPDVIQRLPADGHAQMTRVRNSYYTREIRLPNGMANRYRTAMVGLAAAPYVDRLRSMQLLALGLACAIGAGSVFGGRIAARRVGRLIDPLVRQLDRLPRSVRAGECMRWQSSSIAEIARLTDSARKMENDFAAQLNALATSERRFRAIADNLPGGVYERVLEPSETLRFSYLSPYYADVFGIDLEAAQQDGSLVEERILAEDRPKYRDAIEKSARSLSPFDVGFRFLRADGSVRWLRSLAKPQREPDGSVVWHGITVDETARKRAETKLDYLARYDSLTGLFNRRTILEHLHDDLADRATLAVICIDLDRIKSVNDTLGHPAGDQVVREAGRRIRAAVRIGDKVGRYGGDEFVVIAPSVSDPTSAATVAGRILSELVNPIRVEGHQLEISGSIGILLGASREDGAAESLRKADVALYDAKKEGRGSWRFYREATDERLRKRAQIVRQLRDAPHRDELFLEYQPKVDLRSGRVIGVEALVRWQHPSEGVVSPDLFIPAAEESGLIEELGVWVLRRACADLARWRAEHPAAAPEHVSVNVSGHQLASDTLWDAVWSALDFYDLPPESLELEVTERVLYDAGAEILGRLTSAGVGIAVDDYGTGYSSLLVIRKSPASVVKIDRTFIGSALNDPDDRAIVASTIELAHALRRTVVAEGVETAEHIQMLQELGCDAAQGYYLARPAPATHIPALCRSLRHRF